VSVVVRGVRRDQTQVTKYTKVHNEHKGYSTPGKLTLY